MRGNRDIFSGKSIYNGETIRQEHRISEYRIKIQSNDSIGFRYYGSKGSTCGVMVIVVGNGHGDTSSNPRRD